MYDYITGKKKIYIYIYIKEKDRSPQKNNL